MLNSDDKNCVDKTLLCSASFYVFRKIVYELYQRIYLFFDTFKIKLQLLLLKKKNEQHLKCSLPEYY